MGDFWVFGYGSLIWNPGFDYVEAHPAKLYGLHRSLCIYSWVHRGTEDAPGLVLGLDKGGSCHGMGFRVHADNRDWVIDYLTRRELVTNVYNESWRRIRFENGNCETALTYVVDRSSPQYSGLLNLQKQIEIVASASGGSGPNCEYILNTVEHLKSIKIRDHNLETIADSLGARP
jgi:cation transport protein ChaC